MTFKPLHIVKLTYLLGHGQALGVGDGVQLLLLQLLNGVLVIPQIELGAHQDDGRVGAVVANLWVPLKERGRERVWSGLVARGVSGELTTLTPEYPFKK